MPIYEYVCAACGSKSSVFFRSISAVEESPVCPCCGERALQRRMSRFWSRRSSIAEDDLSFDQPICEHDGVPFYGGDPSMLDDFGYGDQHAMDDTDEGDVVALAREAREASAMMGEPLEVELDVALRHIEQGADPDDVLGEMDAHAVDPSDDKK